MPFGKCGLKATADSLNRKHSSMSKSSTPLPVLLLLLSSCLAWTAAAQGTAVAPDSTATDTIVAFVPQAIPSPHNLVARLNFFDFGRPNGAEPTVPLSNGLEATYVYNANDWLNVGVPLKIGLANFPGSNTGQTVLMLDGIAQVQFNRFEGNVVPYVFAGGGFIIEQFRDFHLNIPAGLGVNIRAGNNSFISVQAEYRKAFVTDRDGLALGFGWWFKLGTYDNLDEWPLDDMDADGIADSQDLCPDEFGEAATGGCPDLDGDLVADKDDLCPEEPGTPQTKGCPDTDGDGIADHDDACPDEAGIAANNGCPVEEVVDTDNDGIPDNEDACPNQPGTLAMNGCPDADRDGIPDKDDACPEAAGPLSTSGCPDTDGDGIIDRDDACPDEAGTAANNGCPVLDADGDGVEDAQDNCPDRFGKPELNGCPDTDGDGIADKDDLCPEAAGTPEMGGCPDSDGDGIPDNEDACPDQPGLLSLQGCPMQDRDRDGIADSKDACPDEPGTRATSGCPDADGDGVADKDDLCPDQAGTLKGCPDTDGDGVADHMDNCPSTAGSALNYGCPDIIEKEDRERLEYAAQAVQFETGKATLKAESYAILDEVVAILRKYPEYEVVIRGHTDNTGSAQANLVLSEERAKSCYEYLIARGIEPERLSYEGVGEREPIADNSTEEGRQLNRRVEFRLIPKKQ